MTRPKTMLLATLAALTLPLAQAQGREFVVTQKGQQFSPRTLTIKTGDEIVFVNDDVGTHNVFSETPGNSFDLKAQRPGTKTKVGFASAGRVDVRCAIHPAMRLAVDVE